MIIFIQFNSLNPAGQKNLVYQLTSSIQYVVNNLTESPQSLRNTHSMMETTNQPITS